MKFLFELFVFLLIASVAVLIGAGVLWLFGLPFHLEFKQSVWLAIVGLVFVLPGVANIWIMFRGGDGESPIQRVLAGIRGFGMLLIAVAGGLMFVIANAKMPAVVCLIIGAGMFFLSLPFTFWLRHREMLRRLSEQPSHHTEVTTPRSPDDPK